MKISIFCRVSAFAFLLLPFVAGAQITKATGGNYVTLMEVPENQVAQQVNTYKGQGYLPVFVDAMVFEGKKPSGSSRAAMYGAYATLIFKKNTGQVQFQLGHYSSSNDFTAQYAALKGAGWHISHLDAYLGKDNKEKYFAIWVKQNVPGWGILVDMPPAQHQTSFENLAKDGYFMVNRAYHRQPAILVGNNYEVNMNVHITSLFRKGVNPTYAKSKLSYVDYAKLCMDKKQQGYILSYLDINDEKQYSPIFTKNPNYSPSSAFPAHGQTSQSVKQAIEQKAAEGYYPLFVICDSGKQQDYSPRYAVFLVKPK